MKERDNIIIRLDLNNLNNLKTLYSNISRIIYYLLISYL